MKIGEIWQERSKPCVLCPPQDITMVKILGFKQGNYEHMIQYWHPCTGIMKVLFAGHGYGDIVIYEYINAPEADPGNREMAREAFLLLWEPCYELVAT